MKAIALALALVAALAAPVSATTVPDGEAFVQYAADYIDWRTDIYDLFGTYYFAQSASEKSTAAMAVQKALVKTVAHFEDADVRPCFEDFAALVAEEFDSLIRYFEEVEAHPGVANALLTYYGAIVPMTAAQDSIVACAAEGDA